MLTLHVDAVRCPATPQGAVRGAPGRSRREFIRDDDENAAGPVLSKTSK